MLKKILKGLVVGKEIRNDNPYKSKETLVNMRGGASILEHGVSEGDSVNAKRGLRRTAPIFKIFVIDNRT